MKTFEEFKWFGKKKEVANYDPTNLVDPYGEETWVDEDEEKMKLIEDNLFEMNLGYLQISVYKIYLKTNKGYLYLGETYLEFCIINGVRQLVVYEFTLPKKIKYSKKNLEKPGFFRDKLRPINKLNIAILKKRSDTINFDKLYKLIEANEDI